jgi:hypothetical protein
VQVGGAAVLVVSSSSNVGMIVPAAHAIWHVGAPEKFATTAWSVSMQILVYPSTTIL